MKEVYESPELQISWMEVHILRNVHLRLLKVWILSPQPFMWHKSIFLCDLARKIWNINLNTKNSYACSRSELFLLYSQNKTTLLEFLSWGAFFNNQYIEHLYDLKRRKFIQLFVFLCLLQADFSELSHNFDEKNIFIRKDGVFVEEDLSKHPNLMRKKHNLLEKMEVIEVS